MTHRIVLAALLAIALGAAYGWRSNSGSPVFSPAELAAADSTSAAAIPHRSPMEVAITPDGRWLIAANSTADSLSLIDLASGQVTQEARCGARPTAVAITPGGNRVLVTSSFGDALEAFEIKDGQLQPSGSVTLRGEPRGMAVSPTGAEVYVTLAAIGEVAVVSLPDLQVKDRIAVDAWPRHVAVSPNGEKLAVATNGNRRVAVIDAAARKVLFTESFGGLNAGQMQISADGNRVYFPWMVYRHNPINARNIKLGWVLGSRIGYIRLDEPANRFAITLDVPGLAMSDPHGLAISPDGEWVVCAAGGTQELLVYRLDGLPFQDVGGPGDHIDPSLARDRSRFYRVPLGGRPLGVTFSPTGRHVYVANYLSDAIQEVDLTTRAVSRTFHLGGPRQPSLARQGEAIFYDGRRSLDQWYSCHSCHFEGGTNAVTMDTWNDGSDKTFKTVLSLVNVNHTKPWTWHGWQQDLGASLKKSLVDTMLGPQPTDDDARALAAFFETLQLPPNPHRQPDGSLNEAALRGQAIFRGSKAGCSQCHAGAYLCDDQIHDVGQGSDRDVYQGFNTPSLLGVHRRVLLLHHGRAKSFEELLTEYHNPANVAGEGELTNDERRDLIEYLKSL